MRLVTYLSESNQERLGLHFGEMGTGSILDIGRAYKALKLGDAPTDMLTLIRDFAQERPRLEKALEAKPGEAVQPETQTRLISAIPRPPSMRDGYAFRQHVETARRNRGVPMIEEFDQFPIFYYTNHLQVTGPGEVSVQKDALTKLDFELEAAIVIGRGGKNIPAAKADEHIFGYLVMNDWSARGLQMEEMKLNLGPAKGKDFATSLGPYLVTRDELAPRAAKSAVGERHDLRMRAFVNGKQVSAGNLKDMTWSFAQILERVSYGVTVQTGEVIGSGTVGTGCFLELNGSKITDNWWLKPGDEVTMEIDGLGRLTNKIVEGDESYRPS